jgi:hypothetical protein
LPSTCQPGVGPSLTPKPQNENLFVHLLAKVPATRQFYEVIRELRGKIKELDKQDISLSQDHRWGKILWNIY